MRPLRRQRLPVVVVQLLVVVVEALVVALVVPELVVLELVEQACRLRRRVRLVPDLVALELAAVVGPPQVLVVSPGR